MFAAVGWPSIHEIATPAIVTKNPTTAPDGATAAITE